MRDKVYERIKKRRDEVYVVEPNDLHTAVLNNLYKISTSPLKSFPFKVIIPAAIAGALLLYFLTGSFIANVVSILQYGF